MQKIAVFFLIIALNFTTEKIHATGNAFMRIYKTSSVQIPGEATADGYTNWIELGGDSKQILELPITSTASGPGAGKADVSAFTVQMIMDQSTVPLKSELLAGRALYSVDIWYLKQTAAAGGNCNCPYYKVHMENVFVTTMTEVGSEDGSIEYQVSFTPKKIAWAYYKQSPNGQLATTPTTSTWDLSTNTTFPYSF